MIKAVALPDFHATGTCGANGFGAAGGDSGVAPGGAAITPAADSRREKNAARVTMRSATGANGHFVQMLACSHLVLRSNCSFW